MPELKLVGDDGEGRPRGEAPRPRVQRKQPDGRWLPGAPKPFEHFEAIILENLPRASQPGARNAIHAAISAIIWRFGKDVAYATMDRFRLKDYGFNRYEG